MRLIVRVILIVTVSCIIILYAVQSFPSKASNRTIRFEPETRSALRSQKQQSLRRQRPHWSQIAVHRQDVRWIDLYRI